jgi:hypothetical protein
MSIAFRMSDGEKSDLERLEDAIPIVLLALVANSILRTIVDFT